MTTPRKRSFDVAHLDTQATDELKAPKRQNCTVSTDSKTQQLEDSAPLASDQHQDPEQSKDSVATNHSVVEPIKQQATMDRIQIPKPKPRTFTLHLSTSATAPTITLTIPPKEDDIEVIQEDNDTPVQDWKHGNALVVPSCDTTRHITYINPPEKRSTAYNYEESLGAETDVGSEVDLDDYDFWLEDHNARPSSPVPPDLDSDHPHYLNFPSASSDTEYMFEPGHVSTYTFVTCNGMDEQDDSEDSSDIEDFFYDAAA